MAITTVSGTVVDPDAIAWANGSVQFQLINPSSGIAPNVAGVLLTQAQMNFTVALDGTGSFSTSVTSTSSISPAQTQWRVTFDSNTSAPGQTLTLMPINGGSLSLNTQIAAQIAAIRLAASPSTLAYADIEIIATPPAGATYYNTTTNTTRQWTGSSWTNSGGGGGGGGGNTVTLENVFSGPGSFNFVHNLNNPFCQVHCVTRTPTGYAAATWVDFPVDANTTTVTVPAAGDYICTFSAGTTASFLVGASPASISYWPTGMLNAATQTTPVTVTQTGISGYASTVTYSVSGLPSGMTGAFSPTTVTGSGTTTLTLSFPPSQAAATTTFSIQATDGTITRTASVTITVNNLNQGLIEGWAANDGSGNIFVDSCLTGNNETLATGTLTWATNAPLPGSTGTLSATGYTAGANQTATNFDGLSPFSFSVWVKVANISTFRTIISTLDPAVSFRGWELGTSPTKLNVWLANVLSTNAIQVTGSTTIVAGTLYYVAVTYDGSRTAAGTKIYINGILETPTVGANSLSATLANAKNVALGARVDGTTPLGGGIVAYVRIYNRALSSVDVANYFPLGAR